jgi:hypothetical protein
VQRPPGNYGIATGSYERERDDWRRALDRARAEGWRTLELTAVVEPLVAPLVELLQSDGDALAGFDRVSLHAPVAARDPAATATTLAALPLDGDVIFHPDAWRNEPALAAFQSRVVFENMDVAKSFGRSVADLRDVFDADTNAGFCLDVAHVWTNDPTLALGHELLDAFGDRLRQLHVSGIEPDGTHRPTTEADLALYTPLLDRCGGVPWILEGVLV